MEMIHSLTRSHAGCDVRTSRAARDLIAGAAKWRLWWMLAWLDIRQRYRRSMIGPFWITISMVVMVGTLALIYSTIFALRLADFLPYLAAGFLIWFFISAVISEACLVFVQAEGMIKQGGLPHSLHIFRLLGRHAIIFAHNFVIIPLILAATLITPSWWMVLAVPGLVLLCANLAWIALVLGPICTRFRDVPYLITSLLQVVFFVTPILFQPQLLRGQYMFVVWLNPAHHLIEIVRAPLLGQPAAPESWLVSIALAVAGWGAAFALYRRVRGRIAYWL